MTNPSIGSDEPAPARFGTELPAPYASVSVLPGTTPTARRGRGLLVAGAAASGVALVAAGAWVAQGLLGGGSRADEHLPGTAAVAVLVDLDPSAGQKLGAVQFAHRFAATDRLDWGATGHDPRQWLYEHLTDRATDAPAWSEIDAWLGKRAGLAELPPSGSDTQPVTVVALQVTDVDRATTSLTRGGRAFVAVDGDWVLVSDTQAHADAALRTTTSAPLSASPDFRADLLAIGEPGVADLWVDGPRVSRLAATVPGGLAGGLSGVLPAATAGAGTVAGHGAVALRFDGATLELAGSFRGLGPDARPSTPHAAVLAPADAAVAVSIAGLGEQVDRSWPTALERLGSRGSSVVTQLQTQTGLQLPGDLVTLLGSQFTLTLSPADGRPNLAIRVVTPADPSGPLDRLTAALAAVVPTVQSHRTSDGYVLALTEQASAALADSGGLSTTPAFVAAVPHAGQADAVAYVDIPLLVQGYGKGMSEADKAAIAPLGSLGMSSSRDDGGGSTFTVRLTTR